MLYAVCRSCPFLRAYSSRAERRADPGRCPACGAELDVRADEGRFHSAYVGKVSLELMATPELRSGADETRQTA
jgi:hypothetical protein